MKVKIRLIKANALLCVLFSSLPTAAQIVPDATLPVDSSVTPSSNSSTINGGTKTGTNLFHSFEQFSVPTGGEAYFNNTPDIQNIFSRVTGGSISNIDGIIRANGTANLFFLNPNGIIFGPNTKLNIGGSFLGSSASGIDFADGVQFSAKSSQNAPLLTVSVPIGLQFGQEPGAIRVQGRGHSLIGPAFSPIIDLNNSTGLSVQSGKTLALVGGDIALEGGVLTAPGGRIELGSVSDGLVTLSSTPFDWNLGYEGALSFKNIQLSQRASANTSGNSSGSIQIQAANVRLSEGSVILIQNQGLLPSGALSVNASESLEVSGPDPIAKIIGGFRSETVGLGIAGDITVSTKRLVIQNAGQLSTLTFSTAKSGNITVNASDSVQISGVSPRNPNAFSVISAATFNAGDAGSINISAGQLAVTDGASLSSSTFGTGKGGNTTISATDSIKIIGSAPITNLPSVVSAATLSDGDAGNLRISTPELVIQNGGRIDSSTVASGKAGGIDINASAIDVSGSSIGSREPSAIISSANIETDAIQKLFRLPSEPTGDAGNITIDTKYLNVSDGGLVGTKNDGLGDAGVLQIYADSLKLNNSGSITASTAFGRGGEIYLQAQNLQLQNNSTITAAAGSADSEDNKLSENITNTSGGNITIGTSNLTALENSKIDANAVVGNGGNVTLNIDKSANWENSSITANALQGNGGNLTIDTNKLLGLEDSNFSANAAQGSGGNLSIDAGILAITRNSSISANAIQGNGGIIDINAQALFRSPDSSITANSQYGINGIVQINNLLTNPSNGLVNLPVQPFDVSKLVAQVCNGSGSSTAEGSSFIVTGRGGLPAQLGEPLTSDSLIINGKSPKPIAENRLATVNTTPNPLVEATGWVMNDQGEVVLTQQPPSGTVYSSNSPQATCYAP